MKHISLLYIALIGSLFIGLTAVGLIGLVSLGYAQEPTSQDVGTQVALGSAFTYQGNLKRNDSPVTENCDMIFRLYDDASAGNQIGSDSATTVPVSAGLFSVELNGSGEFGSNAFTGDARWLGVRVRCPAGGGSYTVLTPRQKVTLAPYALYSSSTGALQGRNVSTITPLTGQVLEWDGSQWTPAIDDSAGGSDHTHNSLNAADGDPQDALFVDNDGNVGLGMTNPGHKLTIKGSGNEVYSVMSETGDDSVDNLTIQIAPGSGTPTTRIGYLFGNFGNQLGFLIGNLRNAPLRFGVGPGPTERMRIDVAGNVGVGTTSPQSKLQVDGYIQLDTVTSTPPVADCDEVSEEGRMKFDPNSDILYICSGVSGWVSK